MSSLRSNLSMSPLSSTTCGTSYDELSPPTVKQHLAALSHAVDWLVTGDVTETNPAHAVRGPRYTFKKGKTPILRAEEAHALLESIPLPKDEAMIRRGPINLISLDCATAPSSRLWSTASPG